MAIREPTFLIHHLTDIHLGPLQYSAESKLSFVPTQQESRNLNFYYDYLQRADEDQLPDLVVASGDFTSYASEDEMNAASDALNRIVGLISRKRRPWRAASKAPYAVIVPGNHDLDWSKSTHESRIQRYSRLADGLYQDGKILSSTYKTPHENSWDFGDDVNVFVYLLDSTRLGGTEDPELKSLYSKLSTLRDASSEEIRNALQKLEKQSRRDPGWIDPKDLKAMRERAAQVPANRIKIAVLHHNPTTVPSDDIEAFDVIVNAGLLKQSLAMAGFDLVLFGHRHVLHSAKERLATARDAGPSYVHFISGDSVGCKEYAPFTEISFFDTVRSSRDSLPACYFAAASFRYSGGRYVADPEPLLDGTFSPSLQQALECAAINIGRATPLSSRARLLQSMAMLLPPLQELQNQMVDWSEDSSRWIERFHYHLNSYTRIYATDMYRRSSTESSLFSKYLREQYSARMARLLSSTSKALAFPGAVYRAILRTGWEPDAVMWSDWDIVDAKSIDGDPGCEIARILVWPQAGGRDPAALAALDFDHKFFAIPLFIIDPSALDMPSLTDFAIGFGRDFTICYEFLEESGKVEQVSEDRGYELSQVFHRILENPGIKTIDEFLGYRRMIRDPRDLNLFAKQYDGQRRASPKILDFLRNRIPAGPGKAGIDIGCGTGNYTVPFENDFGALYGLDINEEMLAVARPKSAKIQWLRGNGLRTGLEPSSVDAAWLISSLHYFKGESQRFLFGEVYRVLKPDGVLVADTEFAEQHESLWLVEYFPSLQKRFRNAIFPTQRYEEWLRKAGFREIRFEHMQYDAEEGDAFLRIGQHRPEVYLTPKVRAAIPAFKQMKAAELKSGLEKLKRDIDSGAIKTVIAQYEARATMPGDLGFILAKK